LPIYSKLAPIFRYDSFDENVSITVCLLHLAEFTLA
jgi:hypothetical protein